jgi:tetratricopeptide (TPR) repeat protein
LLRQNLDAKVAVLAGDAYEKSLFQLGSLLFKRRSYDLAQLRLQEAVDRYPANPNILSARERLAESFHQLAYREINSLNSQDLKDGAQLEHRRRKDDYLDKAVASYEKLADDLGRLEKAGKLPESARAILTRALFALADCRFEKGEYEEAFRQSKGLAQRYAGRVESLIAYQNVWRCAGAKGWTDEARAALAKAQAALKALPDEAFQGAQAMSRKDWQNWIDNRAALVGPPGRGRPGPAGGGR